VAGCGPSIIRSGRIIRGCRGLLQLRPRGGQQARCALCRYPEHGRQLGQADRMAVDQVEDLAVSARERIECCPDPAGTDGVSSGRCQLCGPTFGNFVVGRVEESEGFGQVPGGSGWLRRSARSGPRPIAIQAFPAAEREQPGPHSAPVLQASG
jgi:LSD1 subclass zinc finger protein